jgi:hypothetical protein
MPDKDRGRGVLSQADRQYLRNPDGYSRQAAHERKQAIAERVENSVLDFRLLAYRLPDDIVNDVFAKRSNAQEGGATKTDEERPETRRMFQYIIRFLIRAVLADVRDVTSNPTFHPDVPLSDPLQPFIRVTETGIESYLNSYAGLIGDVKVSVQAEEGLRDLEEYKDELEGKKGTVDSSERLDAAIQLGRAGYSKEDILDILGVSADKDSD